nr:protein spt23 [Quercus suber]
MDRHSTDPMGDEWMFSEPFGDPMVSDSSYAGNAFNDFTNLESYADSPGLSVRTPSRPRQLSRAAASTAAVAAAGGAQPSLPQQHLPGLQQTVSAESSSQDSASDSSSRRKRKVTSESPLSDAMTEQPLKQEEMMMELRARPKGQAFDHTFTRPMNNLSLEQDEVMGSHFDFNSAASSPTHTRDYKSNTALNAQMSSSTMPAQYRHSPVQTINPGMFHIGAGREESPGNTNMMLNSASPNALFSSPSSGSNDNFNASNNWNQGLSHNPAWSNDFNQFTSPGSLAFTPSPIVNNTSPVNITQNHVVAKGQSPLHIAPISTKSRVETQINIIMTLEKPQAGVEYLHLPLHTIAKSKLLAKEEHDQSKVLELHTMLVCTSAMRNAQFKEKALQRAALQDNMAIQNRADQLRGAADEEKNDMNNVDEADKPANGGEVRICNNCIQRERKRAGRKKLKKEEEQQHWERFETERVVVFNSNEYLQFKPWEPIQCDNAVMDEQPYVPPEGSIQVNAAMRIACYCRHQSEKEGFQVIFTLKDQQGLVAAQQISDSILITDDHKTHPPLPNPSTGNDQGYYQTAQFQGSGSGNGLPTSYSMVDLTQQVHPFTSSRSVGNLQALAGTYGQGFNPQSHIHQMRQQSGGFTSQTTSATMTPTTMSRPASPTSAGQVGPNKKRKSSTFHRRMPSGLTMTPRVDTSQPPSSNLPSAVSMSSPFSPSQTNGFGNSADQGYMTIPNNGGSAQYFGSGPPTPSTEHAQYAFTQAQLDNITRAQNAQAYFSHPSSRVPSRAASPVLQASRPNMAAYGRHPIQTPTNSMQGRPQGMYGAPQAATAMANSEVDQSRDQIQGTPTITKITPAEGPTNGGTEVSIYGYNFTNGMQVMFGEQLATTVFYGNQALLATAPPSRPGGVHVTLVLPSGNNQYPSPSSQRQIFTYTQTNPRVMEMAMRLLNQAQSDGSLHGFTNPNQFNDAASQFAHGHGQGGMRGGPGYDAGNMMACGPAKVEDERSLDEDPMDKEGDLTSMRNELQSKDFDIMPSLALSKDSQTVSARLRVCGTDPYRGHNLRRGPWMHENRQVIVKLTRMLMAYATHPAKLNPDHSSVVAFRGMFGKCGDVIGDDSGNAASSMHSGSVTSIRCRDNSSGTRSIEADKMILHLSKRRAILSADFSIAILDSWISVALHGNQILGNDAALGAFCVWYLMPVLVLTTSTLLNIMMSREFGAIMMMITTTTAATAAFDDASAMLRS